MITNSKKIYFPLYTPILDLADLITAINIIITGGYVRSVDLTNKARCKLYNTYVTCRNHCIIWQCKLCKVYFRGQVEKKIFLIIIEVFMTSGFMETMT